MTIKKRLMQAMLLAGMAMNQANGPYSYRLNEELYREIEALED